MYEENKDKSFVLTVTFFSYKIVFGFQYILLKTEITVHYD